MKYLGIDYGTKRIGVAVSDDSGAMAFPYKILKNAGIKKSAKEIIKLCTEEKVSAIVIGKSINYRGVDNYIMSNIYKLEEILKKEINIPIYYEDERLTSKEAEHIQGNNDLIDASAAAIILNSYLAKEGSI